MFVTTTGIAGKELDTVVHELQHRGWTYEAALTTRTNVLVAKPSNSGGGSSTSSSTSANVAGPTFGLKVTQALKRPQTITVVTLAWVLQGACAKDRLREFRLHTELFGMRVSTTSLTDRERGLVEAICQREASFYMTSLCRRCRFLIVSDEGTAPHNEKMLYAEKHPTIERMAFSTFVARFGRRQTTAMRSTNAGCNTGVVAVRGSGVCDDDDDGAMQLLARASSLVPPAAVRLSHVVCYCTPPSLITPQVRRTLQAAQVHRAPIVTAATTHVVLLGPTSECIYPRPGLSFVSIHWLEACVRASEAVPEDIYRVVVPYCPTITFGSLNEAQRTVVQTGLKRRDGAAGVLPCHVQDMLLLGPRSEIVRTMGSDALPTTHLVVPREHQASSRKVQAWVQRCQLVKRHECYLVDFGWIVASVAHGAWVDVDPYTLSYKACIEMMSSTSGRDEGAVSTSNERSCRKSSSSARSSAVPHVVVPDGSKGGAVAATMRDEHHGAAEGALVSEAGEGVHHQSQDEGHRRPSFDSQQLNLSLEVLVGKLEQHVNASHHHHHVQHHQQPPYCRIEGNNAAAASTTTTSSSTAAANTAAAVTSSRCAPPPTFVPPPPLVVAPHTTSADTAAAAAGGGGGGSGGEAIGLPPKLTESIMIGPSFATGMSPLGSRDTLGFPTCAAAATGSKMIAIAAGRTMINEPHRHDARPRLPVESQLIVYQHNDMTQQQMMPTPPPPRAAGSGGTGVLGAAATTTTTSARHPHVLGMAPLPPTPRPMRLLLAKALRDDAASVKRLQALGSGGVRLVDVPEDATHYVVAKPSKTETFLCALAAGLWILKPSFVGAFLADGWDVKEEAHEWANDAPAPPPPAAEQQQQQRPSSSSSLAALVDACVLQRRRGGRSFASWRCVYLTCSDATRAQSFARVLRCGGCPQVEVVSIAHILNVSTNIAAVPQRPTHILTDDNMWDDAALARVEDALRTTVWRLEYLVHTLCCATPVAEAGGGEGRPQPPAHGNGVQKREPSPMTTGGGDGFKARSMTLKKRARE